MKYLNFNCLVHFIPTVSLFIIMIYVITAFISTIINYWYEILHHVYTPIDILFIIAVILSIIGFILMGIMMWGDFNENFK